MDIADYIMDKDLISGEIEVEGKLLVDGYGKCWLAASTDEYLLKKAILLEGLDALVDKIYDEVPPSGGGCAVYVLDCITILIVEHGKVNRVKNVAVFEGGVEIVRL